MALTTISVTATSLTPDKTIRAGVDAQATIYTCPTGRKFIGQAVVGAQSSSTIYMKPGGTSAAIQGGSGAGHSWNIYLSAGESVIGQYAAISGIESDA